jgi:hypothetical protein
MKNEKTNAVVETATKSTKNVAAKSAAKKTTKPAKKAAKKTTKPAKKAATVVERKTSIFSLAPKTKVEDMGAGQRASIAKLLKKSGGMTRAQLIAALPDVPPANISWHLSMMVGDKSARKAAQK